MNQTQKGVLIALAIALLGGGAYYAFKQKGEALQESAAKLADTATDTAKQASNLVDLGASIDKSSRLIADAGAATVAMKDLFKDGKTPDQPTLDAARARIETALAGVATLELPAGAEGAAADMLKKSKENAARALDLLKTLPADAAGALAGLDALQAALSGQPAPGAAPDANAAKPAATEIPAAAADTAAPASTEPAATAPATTTPSDTTATEPAATTTAQATPAEVFPAVPRFDILRVEPDGSTVIAGHAGADTKIEILDGDTVVSTAEAGAGGDFAAVFDNPLSAGDHQLTLKATAKDGKTTLSEEVATVSVPKDASGQLLAMVSKPGEASRLITAPETKPAAPAAGEAAETAAATPEAASTTPAPDAGSEPAAPAVKAALQISAVELEGDRIFVAGTADPKSVVAAYADDKKIGETATSEDGHFVIDGVLPLAVGKHAIRVDQQGADGAIAFRAEVPFDRPEGEQVAAVATPGSDGALAQNGLKPLGDGAFDQRRAEAVKALGLLENLYAGGKVPSAEEFAAARSATMIALQSLADFALPEGADAATRTLVASTRDNALKAIALLKALPADGAQAGQDLAAIADIIGKTVAPSGASDAPAEPAAPAETAAPAAENTAPAPAEDTASATSAAKPSQPAKVAQAPLTGTNSSVIIRKGDTLWQISRRVYGKGVRYTTIYLANREQINNPDRIMPGQVFGVPDKALPNAEELHRQRLHGEKIN